jgi:ABC-type glycerol-3-phosphate transport system substrate-binding protein
MISICNKTSSFSLLSIMMILSFIVLVGCSNSGNGDFTYTLPVNQLSEDGVSTVVWKIYTSDFISIWQEPLNQLLAEKGAAYMVKIEYCESNSEDKESFVDTLERMKNNNEQADVIAIPDTIYPTISSKGFLTPLDDFLMNGQGIEIVNALPVRDLARSKYKGVTYGVSAHIRPVGAIAYNKEYLEKYEINVEMLSTDIFENDEVLQIIKNGEGGNVTPYAYNDNILDSLGMWRSLMLTPIDTAECIARTEQGATVNLFETPELKEFIYKLTDYKDKGLLSFPSENGYGRFFAIDTSVHRDDVFESNFVYNRGGQSVVVDTVVVPNMKRPQIAPLWGDVQTGIASWSQNQENALDFLTRLFTDPDIANLIQYGVEGKEYTLQDGVAAYLPGNLLWVFGENYTNALITYPRSDTAKDKNAFQIKYYEQCESFIPDGFRFDPAPVTTEIEAVNAVYYENTVSYTLSSMIKKLFTLNVPDIDVALSEINIKLKEAGIGRIINEFDRQLADWRVEYEK